MGITCAFPVSSARHLIPHLHIAQIPFLILKFLLILSHMLLLGVHKWEHFPCSLEGKTYYTNPIVACPI